MNDNKPSGGIGFTGVSTAIFVALKLAKKEKTYGIIDRFALRLFLN